MLLVPLVNKIIIFNLGKAKQNISLQRSVKNMFKYFVLILRGSAEWTPYCKKEKNISGKEREKQHYFKFCFQLILTKRR